MKKINLLLCGIFLLSMLTISCNKYVSIGAATKVSQLSGNPFMYQLSKDIIKKLSNYASKNSIKTGGKMNLLSSLSTVFTTAEQMDGVKQLLIENYQVPQKKINMQFSSVDTVKDLVSFVAKNGKGFHFYYWNSSL